MPKEEPQYTHAEKDCKPLSCVYNARMNVADPKLLEILVCPVTRASLRYDAENQELISEKAALAYPIRDGIPIMLPDEARKL